MAKRRNQHVQKLADELDDMRELAGLFSDDEKLILGFTVERTPRALFENTFGWPLAEASILTLPLLEYCLEMSSGA